ncbi:MAG: hypothetical protein KGM16_16855 [Bacteroidota bacterium]|nr:hypothetical protein [Bacteroidota bacterium]
MIEILADSTAFKKNIIKLLGSRKVLNTWFGMHLRYPLVDNCTNQYHDFPSIALVTLEMA